MNKETDLVVCVPTTNLLCPNCGRNIGKRSLYNRGYASTESRYCGCGKIIWVGGDGTICLDGKNYNQIDYLVDK